MSTNALERRKTKNDRNRDSKGSVVFSIYSCIPHCKKDGLFFHPNWDVTNKLSLAGNIKIIPGQGEFG
jgi:hypothetical protein